MNLSVGLTTSFSIEKIKWITERADTLGFYGVWVGEDIGKPQEIFTATSLVLLGTRKAKVGIGVTSPVIRNITTVARAAVALDEISPERFRLGLGVGGIQDLASIGIQIRKPTELMRRAVGLLRTIWTNRKLPVNDEAINIRDYRPHYKSSREIPVFMGVRGPKLLTLAAEIADGVILSGPKRYIEEAIKLILERREALQLPRSRFCFVVWNPTILLLDRSDLELAKKVVAVVAGDTPDAVLKIAGIEKSDIETVRNDVAEHGVEKASENIPDRLLDQFCISGEANQICDIFHGYSKLGVDEAVFGPPFGRDAKNAIQKMAQAWRIT